MFDKKSNLQRNISAENFYYYIPKINNNTTSRNIPTYLQETNLNQPEKKYTFFGLNGSSTFDYLNTLYKVKPKNYKISNIYLTNNLRNLKSMKNIERKNMYQTVSIDPSNKLRLSKNADLFHILNKTLKNDKNSLKELDIKKLLGLDIDDKIDDIDNIVINSIEKCETKFKNFDIKKLLSVAEKKDKNRYARLYHNITDKNNNNSLGNENNSKDNNKHNVNFIYNQIFPKIFKEHQNNYNVIDNKLNIYYAENEEQFKDNLIKKNRRLRIRGKPEKKIIINSKYVPDKIVEIKRKLGFLKGITDYSIPGIILEKVKQNNKRFRLNKKEKKEFVLPFQEINLEVKKIGKLKTKILSETMTINDKKPNFV